MRELTVIATSWWKRARSAVREVSDARAYPLGYTRGLDGLRGWMTIGVLLAHTREALAPGAILYMDMFFVMSGYFITGLLIRDLDRYGGIRLGAFYVRRFKRIVPPFAVMIAAYLVLGSLILPDARDVALDAAVAFGYAMNLWRAGLLPIAAVQTSYLGHTWSLALEEQFYCLWPLTLIVLLRGLGFGWRLFGAIAGLAGAVWGWRIWLAWGGADAGRLYNGPDTRADALLVGCALAIGLRLLTPDGRARLEMMAHRLAWPLLGLFLTVTVWFVGYRHRFYAYVGSMLLGALPGALLVVVLVRPADTVLHRLFERAPLVFVGRIFYALYLWHLPVFAMMNWHFRLGAGVRALAGFPVVFALAILSYVLIERHFMRVGRREDRAPAPGPA